MIDLYAVTEFVRTAVSGTARPPRYEVVAKTTDGCVLRNEAGDAYEVSVRKI